MPVVNDVPGAWERLRAEGAHIASLWNVPKEAVYGYFNETAHWPQTLQEFEEWGNRPTKYGISRRDPATGAWHPIMPGTNPDPRLSQLDRGGFPHNITNAEDSDIQRFQQVNPDGSVFGGSWNAQLNAQHPEWAGKNGFQTLLGNPATATARAQGGMARAAAARPMDQNNYVGPAPSGGGRFVSVVDGVPVEFNSQAEAEQNFNQRTGDTGGAPAGGGAGAAPAGAGAPAGGADVPWSQTPTTTSPNTSGTGFSQNAASAANAAVLAWLEKRRLEEVSIPELAAKTEAEKERLRQSEAERVWKETYDRAQLSGYMPNSSVAGKGQAVMSALAQLRVNPQYAGADGETRRAMESATVAQATGIDQASARQAIDRLRALSAQTGQASSAQLVEQVLGQTPGGAGTPTLAREEQQNRTLIDTLGLLAQLRGPERAFDYANTLANVPPEIRAQINAAMQRTGVQGQNPAQRGVLGDLGVGSPATPPGWGPQATAQVMPGAIAQTPILRTTGTLPQPGATQPVAMGTNALERATLPGGPVAMGAPAMTFQGAGLPAAVGPRTAAVQPSGEPFNPGQISPTSMNRTDPYAQKLLWAGFENAGGDIESGKWRYQRSLPTAVGPRTGRLRVA